MANPNGNPKNLKPFKKGDFRINRNGRPKNIVKLRKLAQQIAGEVATKKGEDIIIDGHKVTNIEMVLRQLVVTNPRLFLEYAYGKPKNELEITTVDLNKATDEQVQRIANGEHPTTVMADTSTG